jgi:hypothetical protein
MGVVIDLVCLLQAAAQGGLRSGQQGSANSGVSSYEDVQVPDQEDAYDEDSKHNCDNAEPEDTSSLANEGTYGMNCRDLLDMTTGDLCMVLMKRSKDGVPVPCVCGNPKNKCKRGGHPQKQQRPNDMAPPRFYARLPGRKDTVDGCLDRPAFTAVEVQSILQDNQEEMDQLARSLGDNNKD